MNQPQLEQTAIPIKILCGCGQKYSFEVEPVGGRMGYLIQCPVCGADGTKASNEIIAQHLAASIIPSPGFRFDTPKTQISVPIPPPTNALPARSLPVGKGTNKWLVPGIGGVVVLIVIGAVLVVLGNRQKHEVTSSAPPVKDGLPHTLAELNAWYVEPSQNGAVSYLQGFDALHVDKSGSSNVPLFGNEKLPPLGAAMPASVKSSLTAVVRANKDALQFFAQGAQFEDSRYPVDLRLGIEAVYPHLGKVRSASLLVELSAILHAEARDGKQAANDVLIALGLARSLEAEPSMISQKIRASSVSIAAAALEQTLNRVALPMESLSKLVTAFHKLEEYDARGEGFNRALAGERATTMALLGAPQKLLELLPAIGVDLPPEERNQIAARVKKAGDLKEEQQYYEETFQQLMLIRKTNLPERLKSGDLIRQRLTQAGAKKLAVASWVLSGLTEPAASEATCLAYVRLGLLAVALEEFRATHNSRYPAALTELMPDFLSAMPMDPFDGQELRYRKKGTGYALYSVGPDLKDDSGARTNGKEGDIVFEVVTPAKSVAAGGASGLKT